MKSDGSFFGLCVLLAALSASPGARAAEWDFRELLTRQGVSFEEVRDLVEDREGRLWIATWGDGLIQTRATEWNVYDETTGFKDNWVRCLELDDAGAVWVGTTDGLCRVRGEEIEAFTRDRITAFPSNNSVYALARIADGSLWIAFDDQRRIVSCRDPASGLEARWEVVADEETLAGPPGVICDPGDGRIWVALRDGGVLCHESDRWRETFDEDGRPQRFETLVRDRSGALWGGGSGGLFVLRDDAWRRVETPFSEGVRAIAESPDGELFVGTATGVQTWDGRTWSALPLPETANVRRILFTSDGSSVSIGTRNGLLRGARSTWRRFSRTESGTGLRPRTLCADANSTAICVDEAGRLARFERGRWTVSCGVDDDSFEDGPEFLLLSADDTVWALSKRHVVQVALSSGKVLRKVRLPPAVSPTPQTELFRTSAGELWLLSEAGVHALRGSDWSLLGPPLEQIVRGVGGVDEAAPGEFWVCFRTQAASTGRVERWIDGRVEVLGGTHPLGARQFEAVCCRRDGSVWLGTHQTGISVYDRGAVREITIDDGLASHLVSKIHEAADGTIWVVYRRKGVGSYRDGRWEHYGRDDGLPDWRIDRLVEDRDGNLWVAADPAEESWLPATARGVYLFEPDREAPDTYVDAYPIKGIAAEKSGVFSFSGIDAWGRTSRADLVYSWRIVPASADVDGTPWSPFQKSTWVTMNDPPLPPGEYTFEVRAADSERNPDPTPAAVRVTVLPPWWTRAGFLIPVLLLLMVAVCALSLLLAKQRSLARTQQQLRTLAGKVAMAEEEERHRIATGLHDRAAQDLAAAALRLGVLHSEAGSADGRGTLEEVIRLVKETGEDLRSLSLELSPPVLHEVGLEAALEALAARFESTHGIRCAFESDGREKPLGRSARALLYRCTSELLANVAKHARARGARVSARQTDGWIEVAVDDDGRGLDPAALRSRGKRAGFGFFSIRERLHAVSGTIEIDTGPGRGTRVVLSVPIETGTIGP